MMSPGPLSSGVIVCIDSVTDKPPEGWRGSSYGGLCLLLVFASCFLGMMQLTQGCIDCAIIATLETAVVRGAGVGEAFVLAVLHSGKKIILYILG